MVTAKSELAIEAQGVARRFGARWVLRGVSIELGPGEIVGLLGANGSGKTTLLRIFGTLLKPTAGTARIYGHDVTRETDAVRSELGFLAHTPGLYDDLTARENLRFGAVMLGLPDGNNLDAALERVGLGHVINERVRGFSAGMQRRLSMARLLLRHARVLLLDEPYANLDTAGIALDERDHHRSRTRRRRGPGRAARAGAGGRGARPHDHDRERQGGGIEGGSGPPRARSGANRGDSRGRRARLMAFRDDVRRIRAIVWKDLTTERRSKAGFNSVVALGVTILVLFGFALGPDAQALRDAAAGALWLSALFAGVLAFNRSYQVEIESGALDQLLQYPGSRWAIYVGKLMANALFVGLMLVIVVAVGIALFQVRIPAAWPALIGVFALGALGLVVLGTFYAAMASRSRAREVLLPLLLFPMLVPVLLAAI